MEMKSVKNVAIGGKNCTKICNKSGVVLWSKDTEPTDTWEALDTWTEDSEGYFADNNSYTAPCVFYNESKVEWSYWIERGDGYIDGISGTVKIYCYSNTTRFGLHNFTVGSEGTQSTWTDMKGNTVYSIKNESLKFRYKIVTSITGASDVMVSLIEKSDTREYNEMVVHVMGKIEGQGASNLIYTIKIRQKKIVYNSLEVAETGNFELSDTTFKYDVQKSCCVYIDKERTSDIYIVELSADLKYTCLVDGYKIQTLMIYYLTSSGGLSTVTQTGGSYYDTSLSLHIPITSSKVSKIGIGTNSYNITKSNVAVTWDNVGIRRDGDSIIFSDSGTDIAKYELTNKIYKMYKMV